MLSFYLEHFDTVELNNSFYNLPQAATLEGWHDATPPGFVFAVKASRFITHMKKLKEPAATLEKFDERMLSLGGKLGPILFQLPPRWDCNLERLREFLDALPEGRLHAFEFRDERWFNDEVFDLLRRHNAALVMHDIAGHQAPRTVTDGFIYVRLHGPKDQPYVGSYDDAELRDWAAEILRWRDQGRDVYVYFDNDENAHAAKNALRLKELVG